MSAAFLLARTARDALFMTGGGVYALPFAYLGIAALSVPAAFGMLGAMRRFGVRRVRVAAPLAMSAVLLSFAALARPGGGPTMTVFFVVLPLAFGVLFSVTWLLCADVMDGEPRATLARAYSLVGAGSILGSLAGILLYVGIRYQFKYAFGAIVALFHDVFVTLGVLCFTGREVSLTVVAALLTIAGYSINDTIVVFDRIRERSKALRKEKHSRVMDIAVNETLSRTVITAFTVFLTALSLFIWGGEVLRDFSFAMLVGVVFGTYSSVYVASGLALDVWIALDRRKGVQAE